MITTDVYHKLFFAVVFTAFNLIATSVFAHSNQQPTEASVVELMAVMNVKSTIKEMLTPKPEIFENFTQALFKDTTLNPKQKTQAQDITTKYFVLLAEKIDTPENKQFIMTSFVEACKQHYTQEEVDAQITFYKSDVGKRIISKQNAMMKTYMKKVAAPFQEQQAAHIKQLLPKMLQELQAIPNTTP